MASTYITTTAVTIDGVKFGQGQAVDPDQVRQGTLDSLVRTGKVVSSGKRSPAKPKADADAEPDDDGGGLDSDLESDLESLGLSAKDVEVLRENGIESIEQLRQVEKLQSLKGVGKGRAAAITEALAQHAE